MVSPTIIVVGFLLAISLHVTNGDYASVLSSIYNQANKNHRPVVLVVDQNVKGTSHSSHSSSNYNKKPHEQSSSNGVQSYKPKSLFYDAYDKINRNEYENRNRDSNYRIIKSSHSSRNDRNDKVDSRYRYDYHRHAHKPSGSQNIKGNERDDMVALENYLEEFIQGRYKLGNLRNGRNNKKRQSNYRSHDSREDYRDRNQDRHESHGRHRHSHNDRDRYDNNRGYHNVQSRFDSHGHSYSHGRYDSHGHLDHSDNRKNVDVYSQKHYHDAHFHSNDEPGYKNSDFRHQYSGSVEHQKQHSSDRYHSDRDPQDYYRQGQNEKEIRAGGKDLTRSKPRKFLRSNVVKKLLRISNDIQCDAKDECQDDCADTKQVDQCEDKCNEKFECQEDNQVDQCERDECAESKENDNPSTRGILIEDEASGNDCDEKTCKKKK